MLTHTVPPVSERGCFACEIKDDAINSFIDASSSVETCCIRSDLGCVAGTGDEG